MLLLLSARYALVSVVFISWTRWVKNKIVEIERSTRSLAAVKAHATRRRKRAVQKSQESWRIAIAKTKEAIQAIDSTPQWQILEFLGKNGFESRGIVDLLAVRKNHRLDGEFVKRGDLLQILLIQVKGGNALWPSADDVVRLQAVARHHNADQILLAEFKSTAELQFCLLYTSPSPRDRQKTRMPSSA